MVWSGLVWWTMSAPHLDFNMGLDLGLSKNNTTNNQATSTTTAQT
jgi:hypothetical protein